jgi:hypothetical protein
VTAPYPDHRRIPGSWGLVPERKLGGVVGLDFDIGVLAWLELVTVTRESFRAVGSRLPVFLLDAANFAALVMLVTLVLSRLA